MKKEITRFLDHRGSRRAFVGSLAALSLGTVVLSAADGSTEATVVAGVSTKSLAADENATYLFTHITLKPGTLDAFTAVLSELTLLMEKHGGWKLQGCYLQADGATNTIIDVWEVPNADAVQASLATAAEDPEFQKLLPRIQSCVESETLQVMTQQPVTMDRR